MTVLKNNFWKAGSSGKKFRARTASGVIGTFGIGAMANFGVCAELRVESRESNISLISARRENLRIAHDCIDLEPDNREPGTMIIAELDPGHQIDAATACEYAICTVSSGSRCCERPYY